MAAFLEMRDALANENISAGEYEVIPRNFQVEPGFQNINLPQAHAALEMLHGPGVKPGAGVTVAVIDGGFGSDDGMHAAEDHFLFDGVDAELVETFRGAEVNARKNHGMTVASVIAGAKTGAGTMHCDLVPGRGHLCLSETQRVNPTYFGMAPGVDLDVYGYPLGDVAEGKTRPPDRVGFSEAIREVLRRSSPHVVNMSFGSRGRFVENYEERTLPFSFTLVRIPALTQEGEDPAIFVWAAGNEHGDPCNPDEADVENCIDDPDIPNAADDPSTFENEAEGGHYDATSPGLDSALMVHVEELRPYTVVVAAADREGIIAAYSNRCGVAADWCITAPADTWVADYAEDGAEVASFVGGTSHAAPRVTGGLALMRHFFRGHLSNPELLARLLATADKTGIYADRAIYGQGLLDLGAALNPAGTPLLTTPDISATSIAASSLNAGGAFGDGLVHALAGREAAAFDSLGAPFWYRLDGFVSSSRSDSWRSRLRAFRRNFPAEAPAPGWRVNHAGAAVAAPSVLNLAESSVAAYAGGSGWAAGWEFSAISGGGWAHRPHHRRELGAAVAWREPGAGFGLRAGVLREPESVLGGETHGAFGKSSALSASLGMEWQGAWRGWELAIDGEWSRVDADADGGMVDGMNGLRAFAGRIELARPAAWGEWRLAVSQPPRIERGEMRMTLPAGRIPGGARLYESISAPLRPSGRQADILLHARLNRALGGELSAGALYSNDYGHAAGETDWGFQLRWQRKL